MRSAPDLLDRAWGATTLESSPAPQAPATGTGSGADWCEPCFPVTAVRCVSQNRKKPIETGREAGLPQQGYAP
jgi:hypothetical protein